MVAAAPLLPMRLTAPPLQGRFFKTEAFLDGKDFLFHNNVDRVLFPARMAASIFSFLLALLVFAAAREMFSIAVALIALALLVFDPNFLAHGALVTTDVGSACTLFAAVYAWYRWRSRPSWPRLIVVGLAAGVALATKFTGVLVLPMFLLLALCELVFPRQFAPETSLASLRSFTVRFAAAFAGIAAVAWLVLWAFYGFRYAARPHGLALHPSLEIYLRQLGNPHIAAILAFIAHLHLLPESWLYGLADTKITADTYTSYFFGHVYPHGHLLYFPAAFAIKSTLPFLILLVLACALLAIRRLRFTREVLCLTLPPALYFLVAALSNMNIGARHLLPIYPFLYILGAAAAAALIHHRWIYAALALIAWQAADALYLYPAYMAFGNGLWGGPARVHLYLSDANVDWGQQLIDVRAWLAAHPMQSCWFAYFPDGVVDPSDYGVPCRRLPTADTLWWLHEPGDVPAVIDGPVLISDSDLAGIEFGEGPLNPYEQFRHLRPIAVIDYGVYVFQGRFNIPLAAGLNHAEQAEDLLTRHHPHQALVAAQQAVALAPNLVNPQAALGDALTALHRPAEARVCYQHALTLAQTVEPPLQTGWLPDLKTKLASSR